MPLTGLPPEVGGVPETREPLIHYALSFGVFIVALAVRLAVDAALPPGFPFLTFFPAIVIATFYLGTRSGILCAVLSFFASWYVFLPPAYSFALNWQAALALAFFIFVAAVDIYVIDRLMKTTSALKLAKAYALRLADQRDELFQELQHRVGNNLAMVSAMLKVQARAMPQDSSRAALEEASGRIAIVAEVNRLFHNPAHSVNRLDSAFLENLSRKCLEANGAEARITTTIFAQPVDLPQEVFLPVALTIAESINNAVEHGFGADGRGTISIDTRHLDGRYRVEISDTGAGLAPGFDLATTKSIGLKLVGSFVRQVNGTFEITAGLQTISRLEFPVPQAQKTR